MHAMIGKLQPIRNYVIGEIVEYVERKAEREREMLSLRKWHVLHVLTGWETDVGKAIEDNGMAAYAPQRRTKVRVHSGRHREVTRPLYPGYMFAGFDPRGDLWPTIRGIEGVIRLFMIDGWPMSMPISVIVRIQEIEAAEREPRNEFSPPMAVQLGDVVRIIDYGGFSGFFGEVLEIDDERRKVRMDLEIMGHKTPMWLPEGKFEVV